MGRLRGPDPQDEADQEAGEQIAYFGRKFSLKGTV
jgi:hypothetical protein